MTRPPSSAYPDPAVMLRAAATEFAALARDLGADADTAAKAVRDAYPDPLGART